MPLTDVESEDGVFALVTDLCVRTASKYGAQSNVPQNVLVSKMRSQAYEIVLKKSAVEVQCHNRDPILSLLSYYFTSYSKLKNVAEYKKNLELKNIISQLRQTDFGDNKDEIYKVLRLLIGLSDSVQDEYSPELFQKPFSYGLFSEMLPKPKIEAFGSPQPYVYYPSHVFELPFALKRETNLNRQSTSYTEYTVQSFDSKSLLPELTIGERVEIQSMRSSAHFLSHTNFFAKPYSSWNLPEIKEPRDLVIPSSEKSECHVRVSFPSVIDADDGVKAVYKANSSIDTSAVDIWELATLHNQDVPVDIWDIVLHMPPMTGRHLIGTSSREMALWHRTYNDDISHLNIVSEQHFIRNIMYLTFGIETKSFPFNEEHNCFYMKDNLVLEGISKEHIEGYVSNLLLVGTYYRRLYKFAFNESLDDLQSHGLVYEAAREVMRRYLLEFRLKATEIYEEYCKTTDEDVICLPTLLQVLFHMEPLKYEIETIASIFKLMEPVSESEVTIPLGAELMSYLFNEISMVTHKITASVLYNSLFTICGVYFKFIERFIFEGELDDFYSEFFIRKDTAYVNTRSKGYWDKGYYITQSKAVPEFLRPLAKFILLCGKSFRLLKHCNPTDPLVLISSTHPAISCCGSFAELSAQQRVLSVYRTRCLFVSGAPATLAQILLKREAERKACAEMASLQQARTHYNIQAERKRLAHLIIAEKQHSLRILEQAMAEAKAAKLKSRLREKRLNELEEEAEIAREEVDSKIRDDEKTKMLEYYSKLNERVEKSKMHTEWKIKRLQLSESRMQMISTEERNLKREKLELEHKRNEEMMSMSIQSIEMKSEDEKDIQENEEINSDEGEDKFQEPQISEMETNRNNATSSSAGMFFSICTAAKNLLFKQHDKVDNKKELDAQGNIVPVDTENNKALHIKESTSSDVIGSQLNEEYDNQEFLRIRDEALQNKKKVMAHEFGQIDTENNQVACTPFDEDNNVKSALVSVLEAKRNREKVLRAEFYLAPETVTTSEPVTDAQKEALVNKKKVLGVEYNLPIEYAAKHDPANIAQEEAVRNKEKILGSEDFNLPLEYAAKNDPANIAQEEAVRNKDKILGSKDFNLPLEYAAKNDPANPAQEEAIRNRDKILGSQDFNLPLEYATKNDPANIAQEEAVRNKKKILGSEDFNLPLEYNAKNDPANIAQEEAVRNKDKILGSKDFNLPLEYSAKNDPANIAQEEAISNRDKILGSQDFNLPLEYATKNDPANIAQEEAVRNKEKILGSEDFNLPLEYNAKNHPANIAQEEAVRNKEKILGSEDFNLPLEYNAKNDPANIAQEEAVRNKEKILGSDDFYLPLEYAAKNDPANIAQEEAIRNRDKILGSVDYNLPLKCVLNNDPANIAQEEAGRNKEKILGSKSMRPVKHHERWPPNRSNLKLNLKPYSEMNDSDTFSNVGAVTPGDFIQRLDLETPTTADIPIEDAAASNVFTPHSEANKLETADPHIDQPFSSSHGFVFTLLDEDSEISSDMKQTFYTPDTSPSVNSDETQRCHVDFLHGTYSLDSFDPFGVKDLKRFSRDYLTSKMDLPSTNKSCYTHPAIIMEEVVKKPYHNLFSRHEKLDDYHKVNCDNIATLTACLQRSVMLPLTYQLEVVNNSILTYFLVNLEMYEHLKSLKDYFFLMDGEFCYSICHNLFKRLVKTVNPQELLNYATLHSILDKALGSSISHVHKFSENLSFTISEAPLSFQHSSPNALQCLSLTYTVDWPLNIILSQEALLRYTKVFQFLLKIRRISWMLGQDFQSLKLSVKLSQGHSRTLSKSPHYISVQIFRHNMAALVRALDNYIVATCILSSWKEFENDLKKARTLDDVYNCHVVYIKKVLFKCLLNNRSAPVMKLLNDIFTVILKFSRVLTQGEWQQKEPNGYFVHSHYPQLKELFHLFVKLSKYLHKVITKLMDCGYQRHLAELLTMVNFNGFYDFDNSREEQNTTTQST